MPAAFTIRLFLLWLALSMLPQLLRAQARDTLTTPSGLKYVVLEEGRGRLAKAGDKVSVHYTGKLPNGKIFDSSYIDGSPIKFTLGRGLVIKGWDEILLHMRKGSRVIVVIPPQFAYGNRGFTDPDDPGKFMIPPGSTLVFDMELMKIK